MVNYICQICKKTFQRPNHLEKHMNRITPCVPILEIQDLPTMVRDDPNLDKKKCRFCGRVFSSYVSMRRHVRENCKIAPTARNGDSGMKQLYEHTVQKQIDELKTQNARLEAQNTETQTLLRQILAQQQGAASSSGEGAAVTQNGNNNVALVDNKKNITINVFGKEEVGHISAERIKALLDESLQAPAIPTAADIAVLETAMLVYSDPDHPENLTCYMPNKKFEGVLVHSTSGWTVKPADLVLPPMAQKSIDLLFRKQPAEREYYEVLKELQQNEGRFAAGKSLRPLLERNKGLLDQALEALPQLGDA